MNRTSLSKFLGFFSLAIGADELLFGRKIGDATGVWSSKLVQTFGARELASGGAILTRPANPTGVLFRIGGDLLDLAAAGRRDDPARKGALVALGIVLGAFLTDAHAAARLASAR